MQFHDSAISMALIKLSKSAEGQYLWQAHMPDVSAMAASEQQGSYWPPGVVIMG